mmetsp:Transcript_22782/g.52035  ORF Transcript_22782/g.52035 Transcript_22782/m.52035 type:complete len:138 (-) Transcript_22782:8-421(-)
MGCHVISNVDCYTFWRSAIDEYIALGHFVPSHSGACASGAGSRVESTLAWPSCWLARCKFELWASCLSSECRCIGRDSGSPCIRRAKGPRHLGDAREQHASRASHEVFPQSLRPVPEVLRVHGFHVASQAVLMQRCV